MSRLFTFGKNERLSGGEAIDKLFNEGRSFSVPPFRVFYIGIPATSTDGGVPANRGAAAPPVRILIAVSKKKYKRAVDRNRLRRLIREAYRLSKFNFSESLVGLSLSMHVGFVYTGEGEIPSFVEIEKKMISCLDKLGKICSSSGSGRPANGGGGSLV